MEENVEMLATTVKPEVIAKFKKIRDTKGVPFGKIIEFSIKDSKYFLEMSK